MHNTSLRNIGSIFTLGLMILIATCRKPVPAEGGKQIKFDTVLVKLELQKLSNQALVSRADSAFQTIVNPTFEQQCRLYEFKNSHFLGNEDSPTVYLDHIISIIEENKLEKKLTSIYVGALLAKGDSLIKTHDYQEASLYLYRALQNAKKTTNSCLYAHFNIRLADIEYRQEHYSKSIKYNKDALANFSNCSDKKFIDYHYYTATVDNIALCFDNQNEADSAIYYFRHALDYITSYEDKFPGEKAAMEMSKGVIYGNMGTIFKKTGNVAEAENLFKKSIAINSQKGYENLDAIFTQIKLCELYIERKEMDLATNTLKQIRKAIPGLPDKSLYVPNLKLKYYKLEANYNSFKGDFKESNVYLNAFIKINDSVAMVKKKLIHADLINDFNNFDQAQALEILKKDTEIKRIYLCLAIIVIGLSMVILIVIWRNRTRLKKLNLKVSEQNSDLRNTLTALQESQDENTRLMAMVAHDLRNPMAINVSIASIILAKDISQDDRKLLELIKTSSTNSIEMITDLLNINTKKEYLPKELIEVDKLLDNCVRLLKFKAEEKEQTILLKTFPARLSINQQKVWRVFSNLIVNAIKFSQKRGVIRVDMHRESGSLLVAVRDNGIGIPAEFKDKIFKLFNETRRLGTSGELSFGLGLVIAKQIVDAHQGAIWFDSELDQGTVFFVRLPF